MTKSFEIKTIGPYSLKTVASFEFGSMRNMADSAKTMIRRAFCLDGYKKSVGIALVQEDGKLSCKFDGLADSDDVKTQVSRIFSLAPDGNEWMRIGQKDPVMGELQQKYYGWRPVIYNSPYECAAWGVIAAHTYRNNARAIYNRLCSKFGEKFDLEGVEISSFPLPIELLEIKSMDGIDAKRLDRLRAIAEAAIEGKLDVNKLATMKTQEARAYLEELPGIGPFYSGLIYALSGAY